MSPGALVPCYGRLFFGLEGSHRLIALPDLRKSVHELGLPVRIRINERNKASDDG